MSAVGNPEKRKKKKKFYYLQSTKTTKPGVIETGLKGFLVTCDNEQQCIKESYNLLNEFADNVFGSEIEDSAQCSARKDIDIEDELAKEIEGIKGKKRRFQQLRTMVKGILFISTTVPDPTKLATSIFEDVLHTGRRTRYILKMKPVVITCKAFHDDIRKHLDKYLEEFVDQDNNKELSYKTDAQIRHNTTMTSSHIVWYVRESVEKCAPKWTASLTDPQLVISVYVLKAVCCICLLKKYRVYRKYNLSEVAIAREKDLQASIELDTSKDLTDVTLNSSHDSGTKM